MVLQQKKFVSGGAILVLFLLLVACGFSGCASKNANTASGSIANQGPTFPASTPQLIMPRASGGSAGHGPLVISSPTPVPGGKPGSQQITLGDRILIVQSVTRQKEASGNTTLVRLSLAIQNTSRKGILNQPAFFKLVGSEGDIFGYQYNSSNNFYGPIAAHTTRTGTLTFQIPTAAMKGLYLLYRPEIAAEAVLALLKVA